MTDFERPMPPQEGDERATLTGFLRYQRATLEMKCADLSADQLKLPAIEPSGLSLLGLVRHMAEVERSWFRNVLNGEDRRGYWGARDNPDGEFDVMDADVGEAFDIWRAECGNSDDIIAASALDRTGQAYSYRLSLRWMLCHLIEEYARHNGHADLLRERIDGRTGE